MIEKKEFVGSVRGRDKKYDFSELKPGDCMTINAEFNIVKFRHNVSTALYQWKKYNGLNWKTAVRIENDSIFVYRIN